MRDQNRDQVRERAAPNLCEVSERAMSDIFCSVIRNPPDESCRYFYVDCRAVSTFFFSGNQSPFTPTAACEVPLIIGGNEYRSVEEYVRFKKFMELTGAPPNSTGSHRSALRYAADPKAIEQWIITRGLVYLQYGILQKLKSDVTFYQRLMSTNDKLICYTYTKDPFFAAGSTMSQLQEWFQRCGNSNFFFKMPVRVPLRCPDLACLPNIMDGHNVLGAIYMSLRETLRHHPIEKVNVDLSVLGEVQPQFPPPVRRTLPPPAYRQPLRNCDSPMSIPAMNSKLTDPRLRRSRSPHRNESPPNGRRDPRLNRRPVESRDSPTQHDRKLEDDSKVVQLALGSFDSDGEDEKQPPVDDRDPASIPWTPRSPDEPQIKEEVFDFPCPTDRLILPESENWNRLSNSSLLSGKVSSLYEFSSETPLLVPPIPPLALDGSN